MQRRSHDHGAAEEEEEGEEGELDTSLSSSDEFPTDSARSIAMRKRKIENIVPFLLKRIEEKRMKISQTDRRGDRCELFGNW